MLESLFTCVLQHALQVIGVAGEGLAHAFLCLAHNGSLEETNALHDVDAAPNFDLKFDHVELGMWIQLILKARVNRLCHLKERLTNEPVTKGVVLSKVLTIDVALFWAHHEQSCLLLLLHLGWRQRRRVLNSMNEGVPVGVFQW